MIANWNSKRTLGVGFVVVVAVLVANAAVSYQNISRLVDNSIRVNRTYEILTELQTALSSVQDAETGQRGFIITGREEYLDSYNAGVASYKVHLENS